MGLHYFDKICVPNAPSRNANRSSYYVGGVFAHEESAERLTALTLGVPSRNPIRPRLEEALRVRGGAQAVSLLRGVVQIHDGACSCTFFDVE